MQYAIVNAAFLQYIESMYCDFAVSQRKEAMMRNQILLNLFSIIFLIACGISFYYLYDYIVNGIEMPLNTLVYIFIGIVFLRFVLLDLLSTKEIK